MIENRNYKQELASIEYFQDVVKRSEIKNDPDIGPILSYDRMTSSCPSWPLKPPFPLAMLSPAIQANARCVIGHVGAPACKKGILTIRKLFVLPDCTHKRFLHADQFSGMYTTSRLEDAKFIPQLLCNSIVDLVNNRADNDYYGTIALPPSERTFAFLRQMGVSVIESCYSLPEDCVVRVPSDAMPIVESWEQLTGAEFILIQRSTSHLIRETGQILDDEILGEIAYLTYQLTGDPYRVGPLSKNFEMQFDQLYQRAKSLALLAGPFEHSSNPQANAIVHDLNVNTQSLTPRGGVSSPDANIN